MASPLSGVEVVRDAPKVGRKLRKPSHNFRVYPIPFVIQPCLIAPVLPGETLNNLLLQATAQTHPLADSFGGWWTEFYFFYVKHRDLDQRDLFTQMHLDAEADLSAAMTVPVSGYTYFAGNGIDWVQKCLQRVVMEYFRNEGEAFADATTGFEIDTGVYLPLAKVNGESWAQSIILDGATPENESELPGESEPGVDVEQPEVPAAYAAHYRHWQAMRDMKLTAATFEDFLKSFGVTPPAQDKEELHTPELIRYIRDWEYPSMSAFPYTYEAPPPEVGGDPVPIATSASAMACRWRIAERADKKRFFPEPGFVFGVTVLRPKTYHSEQKGAAVQMLDAAIPWLPAVLADAPYTSLKKVESGTAVLTNSTADWWLDAKDIFMHGDQFVGFPSSMRQWDPLQMGINHATLPDVDTGGINRSYPSADDISALALPILQLEMGQGASCVVDGRVDLEILARLEDTSL